MERAIRISEPFSLFIGESCEKEIVIRAGLHEVEERAINGGLLRSCLYTIFDKHGYYIPLDTIKALTDEPLDIADYYSDKDECLERTIVFALESKYDDVFDILQKPDMQGSEEAKKVLNDLLAFFGDEYSRRLRTMRFLSPPVSS